MNTNTFSMIRIWIISLLVVGVSLLSTPAIGMQDTETTPPTPLAEPVAQPNAATNPSLRSPRATMSTFLVAINEHEGAEKREDARQRAIECLDIEPSLPLEAKWNLALELYTVLGRIGEVRVEKMPDNPQEPRYLYYPQIHWTMPLHQMFASKYPGYSITMEPDTHGNWRFDRTTLNQIHNFALETENEETLAGLKIDQRFIGKVRSAMPASLKGNRTLGLEHWEWIGILLVIFVGLMVDLFTRLILRNLWHRFENKRGREVDPGSLKRAVRPFGMLAGASIWYLALVLGLLPAAPTIVLFVAVRVVLMVSLVWAAFKVTDLVSDWLSGQAAKTETKFDDLLVPMVKRTAKLFIGAIGLIYIASAFSIEIMPLLTGLGIGGLAVAFAAKDTIENFFGSIAVIMDRPFEIGDWVVVNDVEGTVEDLGFRSTRIRTFYNSLVTIPNATLVRAKVDNYGRRKYRRYTTKLNVTYDTHPDKIEAFCSGIREIVKLHPYTRKDYYHVWLNGFGPHSLDILVYIFFECPDWSIELREKHRFMLDVVRLADRLGVEFAFPTQKIHISKDDTPPEKLETPEGNSERRWVLEGRKAARDITQNQPWKDELPGDVSFAEEFDSEHEARGESAG
ncbi:MAG: mechanosensitive ion channel family protein [Phycisphaerales bacterium]|nr:mechanosensitive ion channel family protein [Phycisphaerales bacterium]